MGAFHNSVSAFKFPISDSDIGNFESANRIVKCTYTTDCFLFRIGTIRLNCPIFDSHPSLLMFTYFLYARRRLLASSDFLDSRLPLPLSPHAYHCSQCLRPTSAGVVSRIHPASFTNTVVLNCYLVPTSGALDTQYWIKSIPTRSTHIVYTRRSLPLLDLA